MTSLVGCFARGEKVEVQSSWRAARRKEEKKRSGGTDVVGVPLDGAVATEATDPGRACATTGASRASEPAKAGRSESASRSTSEAGGTESGRASARERERGDFTLRLQVPDDRVTRVARRGEDVDDGRVPRERGDAVERAGPGSG